MVFSLILTLRYHEAPVPFDLIVIRPGAITIRKINSGNGVTTVVAVQPFVGCNAILEILMVLVLSGLSLENISVLPHG